MRDRAVVPYLGEQIGGNANKLGGLARSKKCQKTRTIKRQSIMTMPPKRIGPLPNITIRATTSHPRIGPVPLHEQLITCNQEGHREVAFLLPHQSGFAVMSSSSDEGNVINQIACFPPSGPRISISAETRADGRFSKSIQSPSQKGKNNMDFGKMKDQLQGQMSDKVKEELTQKVDEVKADIQKKFGNFGGTAEQQAEQKPGPGEVHTSDESRPHLAGQTESEPGARNLPEQGEETQEILAVAETDSDQVDDDSESAKEVA